MSAKLIFYKLPETREEGGNTMLRKGLIIYESKGRAQEYCPLALNLYRGCAHFCLYCYAPDATFMDTETFKKAVPRENIIEKLKKDAPKAAADGATGNILLSFTSDCYQPINDIHQLTRQAIIILHRHGFKVTILTKGGHRAIQDFDILGPGDQFATTLTLLDEKQSLEWEPQAAIPVDRIETLRYAHDLGIETWVSLEPVIDPEVTLEIIRQTHTFVDLFKVGKLNYSEKLPEPYRSQVKDIDWRKFAKDVTAVLNEYGCQSYIKQDLRRYL
uniref:Putative radical SAM superfamily protein n=1 Tax=viral metagenome TaxID=1070528 RepID=A0A6M3LAX9_9ZZZZ